MGVVHLVRHGQASFGAEDYDVLSPLGVKQSEALGTALRSRGVEPDLLLSGKLRRQRDTATSAISAGGWRSTLRTAACWDEFDHHQVMDAYPERPPLRELQRPRTYQEWFEQATTRWSSGRHDNDYSETFRSFTQRVEDALRCLRGEVGPGGSAVVFTSGGLIAWIAASLLGAGPDQWLRLNRVATNTGVTTVTLGRSGATLVSFNEHAHLTGQLLTYR
jgi:broad specificity phosphatase PhoE